MLTSAVGIPQKPPFHPPTFNQVMTMMMMCHGDETQYEKVQSPSIMSHLNLHKAIPGCRMLDRVLKCRTYYLQDLNGRQTTQVLAWHRKLRLDHRSSFGRDNIQLPSQTRSA